MSVASAWRPLRTLTGYWSFLVYVLGHLGVLRRAPVHAAFERQLEFTGIDGLRIVAVFGLLVGALVATQTVSVVGGDSEVTVRMLVWTVLDEGGPLLAAIVVIARSGVAIASELALMRARGETDNLEAMGVPPLDYLMVPRVAAVSLASVALTVYFVSAAIAGGLAASALFQGSSFLAQLGRFFDVVGPRALLMVCAKSLAFGLVIATVACYHGLEAARTTRAVPIATVRAVAYGLIAVFLVDGVFAYFRVVTT